MQHSHRILPLLALLSLLFTPGALAANLPDEHVVQYVAFVHTQRNSNGDLPQIDVDVRKVHGWDVAAGDSVLELRANYLVSSGGAVSPFAEFRLVWDEQPLDACEWRVEGGTITGGRFNPVISMFCQVPEWAEPGAHTVAVDRTSSSGTPIVDATTSIILHQKETVTTMTNFEGLTGLTAIEFLIFPALAFLGSFMWSRNDVGVRLFGIFLVLFDWALVLAFYASASGQAWRGLLVLLVMLLPLAGWMAVNLVLDLRREGREAA